MGLKNAVKASANVDKQNSGSALAELMDPALMTEERILQIPVDQIRTNKKNFYDRANPSYSQKEQKDEADYVKGLADVLLEHGQDSHAIVYADDTVGDGKCYTLISGSRRLKAVTLNASRGGDGLLLCKVTSKPEDDDTEMLKIIQSNGIRSKDKKTRLREVLELATVYQHLKEKGKKPKGRKVEWISSQIGLSPRQVGRYLKDIDVDLEDSSEPDTDAVGSTAEKKALTREDKERLKSKAIELRRNTGLPVKINTNFSIVISPVTPDEDSLDLLIKQIYTLISEAGGNYE